VREIEREVIVEQLEAGQGSKRLRCGQLADSGCAIDEDELQIRLNA
jgi:hypothetical protein